MMSFVSNLTDCSLGIVWDMGQKTALNQLLSNGKDFVYPNRVARNFIRKRRLRANIKAVKAGSYLDLGCGPNSSPDFCNLDYRWHPGVDIWWDVTNGLPFASGHIGGIFSEHMLEHIAFESAISLLEECRRVLRPGGTIRLVVPDGERYLSEYARHVAGQQCSMPGADYDKQKFALQTPIVSVNRIFREFGHEFIWDYETLRIALFKSGFAKVERRHFGDSSDPKLLRDTPSRIDGSLYIEAS